MDQNKKFLMHFKGKQMINNDHKYSKEDIQYMESLSEAVLLETDSKSKFLLWTMLIVISILLTWAYFAEIDEIARGTGKVIPSKDIQVIQNLEGGIVSEILVKEGQLVEQGEILLKISNINFSNSYNENLLRIKELEAKILRLKAESQSIDFVLDSNLDQDIKEYALNEKSLFDSNKNQLEHQVSILNEQLIQKNNELTELKSKEHQLRKEYELINKEIKIMEPLVKSKLVSNIEFLQLSREVAKIKGTLTTTTISIPRVESSINEVKNSIEKIYIDYRIKAKEELNTTIAEVSRLKESKQTLKDRVDRTSVRSPVKGIVKQLFIKTVDGVIQPGMNILEIVPYHDELLIEARIKPSDIAYVYPGQDSNIKFTAYDPSIYGGLKGKVIHVSADTIVDEKDNSFYLVRVKTDKNHLTKNGKDFEIMVGMVANVDILTGKKTIMDYLLKPILKTKQVALTER
jgi:membrane fusion protein, adhesin transport system